MTRKTILLLFCIMAIQTMYASKIVNAGKWQSYLRDDVPVCEVSIPGVHDAASGTTHVHGTSVQTKTISELLKGGVRFFDLRCDWCAGHLRMYHNFVDLARLWSGVTMDIFKFLEDNPDEFVICVVKHEGFTDVVFGDDGKWENKMKEYFRGDFWSNSADREKYLKMMDIDFRPDLTVGEMRGHVLFLFRHVYDSFENMRGGFVNDGKGERGFGDYPKTINSIYSRVKENDTYKSVNYLNSIWIQDRYEGDDLDQDPMAKIPWMQRLFDDFTKEKTNPVTAKRYTWCINHSSAYTNDPAAPNSEIIARYSNKFICEYLAQNPELYAGIVAIDYACENRSWGTNVFGDLAVQAIINNNWRHWKPMDNRQEHFEVEYILKD